MNREFTQTFFLAAGEVNAEGELSMALLTSKIIDIATAHANSLGIGNPSMASMHCGWVLSRVAIEMMDYPKVNDTYRLTTWVNAWNKHYSERMIMISAADGRALGYARTIWMVLDTETHESRGLSHLPLTPEMVSDRVCPIAPQGKHSLILPEDYEGDLPRNAMRATAPAVPHRFGYADLDYYRHVNTVRYVQLLLNQFSLEEFDRTRIKRFELWFMREGKYGADLSLLRADNDDSMTTSFSLSDADLPIFFARIYRQTR